MCITQRAFWWKRNGLQCLSLCVSVCMHGWMHACSHAHTRIPKEDIINNLANFNVNGMNRAVGLCRAPTLSLPFYFSFLWLFIISYEFVDTKIKCIHLYDCRITICRYTKSKTGKSELRMRRKMQQTRNELTHFFLFRLSSRQNLFLWAWKGEWAFKSLALHVIIMITMMMMMINGSWILFCLFFACLE